MTNLLNIGSALDRTFRPLQASPADIDRLGKDVGRRARYILPRGQEARARFIGKHGTACVEEFEIIGVQKDHAGRAAYRIKCLAYEDRAGRCVEPDLIRIIEEGAR